MPNQFYLIHIRQVYENTVSNEMVAKITILEIETLAKRRKIGM